MTDMTPRPSPGGPGGPGGSGVPGGSDGPAAPDAADSAIRAALAELRPHAGIGLPGPEWVRGRGDRHRRRSLALRTATAAAVVAVATTATFALRERDTARLVPTERTTTATSPSVAPTGTGRATPSISMSRSIISVGTGVPERSFIPAADWSSTGLTAGHATGPGTLQLEGSIDVASCDPVQQGTNLSLLGIKDVATGRFIGRQRIQAQPVLRPQGTAAEEVAAILAGFRSRASGVCKSFSNGHIEVTAGSTAGTLRVDTVFADGSPTFTEYVGVSVIGPGYISTIVINEVSAPSQGFAELQRLLTLARR